MTWVWDGNRQMETGRLVDGERNGRWIIRQADGTVGEGPYVDGKPNGHFVMRWWTGSMEEGLYVDGKKHGDWVIRFRTGTLLTACTWMMRWSANGSDNAVSVNVRRPTSTKCGRRMQSKR